MTDAVETKCVIIADEELPSGILANTAAILGITLGKQVPECVGQDVMDGSGCRHAGIISIPVPILKGNKDLLRELRRKLFEADNADLLVVDFSDVAQGCRVYSEYMQKARFTAEEEHVYLGLAIYGSKKKINKLTGSLPLLR
jgi:hypothetical protein